MMWWVTSWRGNDYRRCATARTSSTGSPSWWNCICVFTATTRAVGRNAADDGDQLARLHNWPRSDCATRNKRQAARLQRSYDDLEARIERLAEEEEREAMRPDRDGNQIMEILQIGPGPGVGEAYRFLLDLRMDRGPLGAEAAAEALWAWWSAR